LNAFPVLKAMVEKPPTLEENRLPMVVIDPLEAQALGRGRLSVHLHPPENQTPAEGSHQLDLFEPRMLISTTGSL